MIDRDLFLRDVARALVGQELGDGTVARTCREIQRRYFKLPTGMEHQPAQLRKITDRRREATLVTP